MKSSKVKKSRLNFAVDSLLTSGLLSSIPITQTPGIGSTREEVLAAESKLTEDKRLELALIRDEKNRLVRERKYEEASIMRSKELHLLFEESSQEQTPQTT